MQTREMHEAAARWREHGERESHPAERNTCFRIAEDWERTAQVCGRLDNLHRLIEAQDELNDRRNGHLAASFRFLAERVGGLLRVVDRPTVRVVDKSEGWEPPARDEDPS